MKHELELKLQALLDGELTGRETEEIAALLERDAEASALLGELRNTRTALRGNELEIKLPESREFYWSKIEREITRLEQAPATAPASAWWAALRRRYVATLGTVGVSAALMLTAVVHFRELSSDTFDVENLLGETTALTFRSEANKMSLVWIYDNEQPEAEPDGEFDDDDTIPQT
jgi:negative regulator of sigma E activity